MKLYFRKYQNDKIVNLLKKDSFLLFSINANRSSDNWLTLEQSINKLAITYTKTYNNAVRKTFEKSIFKNLKNLIGGTFFFLKPKKIQKIKVENAVVNLLNAIQFTIITTKLNKKLYTIPQIKTINSFSYKKNTKIMYQFLIATLKTSTKIHPLLTQKSEQCDSNT